MRVQVIDSGSYIYFIEDVYTAAECRRLLAHAEALGYAAAPVTTARGPQMLREVRNNQRAMGDDAALAGALFQRLRPHLPPTLMDWRLVGLNERLRWYRYDPGERFDWHRDGAFVRSPTERSLLTVMLYLSDDCDGGETLFRIDEDEADLIVVPKTGAALFFLHPVAHTGAVVTRGRKDVLRTDAMYVRSPANIVPR
ncbi:MAG: 2OG-Fe(II) oxygenase [Myxococcota bacterium]